MLGKSLILMLALGQASWAASSNTVENFQVRHCSLSKEYVVINTLSPRRDSLGAYIVPRAEVFIARTLMADRKQWYLYIRNRDPVPIDDTSADRVMAALEPHLGTLNNAQREALGMDLLPEQPKSSP